jgi:hypothetical protein
MDFDGVGLFYLKHFLLKMVGIRVGVFGEVDDKVLVGRGDGYN